MIVFGEAPMKFPCECGRTYSTAKKFSDHVHTDCKLGTIPWGNAKVNGIVN
jgi:hypothetical protein